MPIEFILSVKEEVGEVVLDELDLVADIVPPLNHHVVEIDENSIHVGNLGEWVRGH